MITIVSGYWELKNSKFNPETYGKWMENALKINAPYVFFTTKNMIPFVKKYRKHPTMFIEKTIDDFYFKRYNFDERYVHPFHVPSIELGLIWLEKISLVKEASEKDPFGNEWYAWIDAAVCTYREKEPPTRQWPDKKKAEKLLKKECLNYTTSLGYLHLNLNDIKKGDYQHRVSGTWIIHKTFIPRFCDWFEVFMKKIILEFRKKNHYAVLSDQVIWTRMMMDKPKLFNCVGTGYGEILNILY